MFLQNVKNAVFYNVNKVHYGKGDVFFILGDTINY